jgi:hypothetical protein
MFYRAWVIGILLPHSVVNVCMIYVGAMLIFSTVLCHGPGKKFWNLFHLQPMWDQKVLTIHCLSQLALRLFIICISIGDHTHLYCYVCRGSFNTSSVFSLMEATMSNPLRVVSLRTPSYKVLNW